MFLVPCGPFQDTYALLRYAYQANVWKNVIFWMIWRAHTSELILTEQFAWLTNSVLNVCLIVTGLPSTHHIDIFRCGLGNKQLLEMLSPSSVHTAKRKFLAFLGVLLSKWLWHRALALNQDQTLGQPQSCSLISSVSLKTFSSMTCLASRYMLESQQHKHIWTFRQKTKCGTPCV